MKITEFGLIQFWLPSKQKNNRLWDMVNYTPILVTSQEEILICC